MADPVGTTAQALAEAFGTLKGYVYPLGSSFQVLNNVMTPLNQAFAAAGKMAASLGGILEPLGKAIKPAFDGFVSQISAGSVAQGVRELVASFGGSKVGQTLSWFGGALGKVAESTVTLGSMFGALLDVVNTTVAAMSPFLAAVDPTTLEFLNQAMQELQATIGVALIPMAQILTGVIRDMAGALEPAVQAMSPVLAKLAELFGQLVVPITQVFAETLVALTPVFDALIEVLKPVVEFVKVLAEVFSSLFKALQPVLKILVGALKLLADALNGLVKGIKWVLSWIPGMGGGREAPVRGAHAQRQSQLTSFEGIGHDVALAAFRAGGGQSIEQQQLNALQQIAANTAQPQGNVPPPGVVFNPTNPAFGGQQTLTFGGWAGNLTLPVAPNPAT